MSIQPKTKSKELLEKFSSFSKDKVLSEFELNRYLVQTKSIAELDAAEAWHIKGLAYYFANKIDEMKYAFSNALRLRPKDSVILFNAASSSMNQAQLEFTLNLLDSHSDFYLGSAKDYDLALKLSKLALNFYDFTALDKIISILKNYVSSDRKINSLIKTISDEYEIVANNLKEIDIDWREANKVSQIAFVTIQENGLRSSAFVETDLIENELFNTIHVFGSLSEILKINDSLFEKIYDQGYLNIWDKFMFTYSLATLEDVKDVA